MSCATLAAWAFALTRVLSRPLPRVSWRARALAAVCSALAAFGWVGSTGSTAQAQARAECAPDALLSRAAAELLLSRVERPSAEALREAVRAVGSDAVGLHALFVPAGEAAASERQWLAKLRTRVDGELSCGRAEGEPGRLLIAIGRGAELAPIDPGDRFVRGELRAGFSDAELVIADADAQLVRVGVSAEDLRKGIELAPDLTVPLKVQLVARGPSGPRPVAERELRAPSVVAADRGNERTSAISAAISGAASAATPAATSGAATQPQSGPAAARELSALLLALRAQRGRAGLRDNRLLQEAATRHANNVCAQGRVAHEVEAGEGPDARLAQAGLSARVLGEAIARAANTQAAMQALENSPSHLYTLLDPRFTDFGVGVAKDSTQKYCYVVLLCAWPRYIGKAKR